MLGIKRRTPVLTIVVLTAAAVAMFAIAATASDAVTAEQKQELKATINSQVSWGSANDCSENVKTNDFGDLVPSSTSNILGGFDATPHAEASTDLSGNHVWVGCVTTNTTLQSVTAAGTENMTSGGNTLPLSDVNIGLTNATGGELHGGTAGCTISAPQSSEGSCPLEKGGAGQTLVSDATEGTTELDWQYQLNLPANQPVGTYTGGEVTFTATV